MSKKILSIVLALTLALSCFAVSAFAIGEVGYEEEGSTYSQAWSLSDAAQDGSGKWYVEVSLNADYAVGAIQFKLAFSNANIKIANVIASKYDGTAGALTDDYGADVAFDKTGKSNIVAIIPNPIDESVEGIDFSEGGVVCTVFFDVPAGASGTVQIVDDAKSATNPGGSLFAARISDGDTLVTGTSITGQAATIETPARNIGAVAKFNVSFDANGGTGTMTTVSMEAGNYTLPECTFTAPAGTEFKAWSIGGNEYAPGDVIAISADTAVTAVWANLPAELVKTASAEAAVVVDTNKTFGGQYAGVVYGFTQAANNTFKNKTYLTTNLEASNGGSLLIKSSTGQTTASGNYGTGSTIEVLNADGTSTGKVYVVVIFGDIDGNGLINTTDANAAYTAISGGTLAAGSVQRMAANCHNVNNANLLHTINTNDALAIYNQISGTKVAAASLAAKHVNHSANYA